MAGAAQEPVVVRSPQARSGSMFEAFRSRAVCVVCGHSSPLGHVPGRCPTCGASLWMACRGMRPDRDGGGESGAGAA
jgi:uncharacterized protein (DUF983 family)